MLGQAISMIVPQVVGYKITGTANPLSTSTDVVLTITKVRNLILLEAVMLGIGNGLFQKISTHPPWTTLEIL